MTSASATPYSTIQKMVDLEVETAELVCLFKSVAEFVSRSFGSLSNLREGN